MKENASKARIELVERFAIRCAKGNNGGEWASHYTEDQKNFWRSFVNDLIVDLVASDIRPDASQTVRNRKPI